MYEYSIRYDTIRYGNVNINLRIAPHREIVTSLREEAMSWFRFGPAVHDDSYEFPPPTGADSPTSTFLATGERRARSQRATGAATPPQPPVTDEYLPPPASPPRPSAGARLPRVVYGGTIPGLTLKLRKRVYPLGITRLTAGMDVDCRTGAVAFKWSWTDRLFGARLSLERNVVALTKRLPVPDMRATVDVRAALDVHTRRTLLSVAVRPMLGGVVGMASENGVQLRQRFPIDKRVDVELFGRVQLPEARFAAGNDNSFSLGEGNFVAHLDHVNLRLMLQ